jgi:drug/metabolite transporter (DMT)-like permease
MSEVLGRDTAVNGASAARHRQDYARAVLLVVLAGMTFTAEAVIVRLVAGEGGIVAVMFCRALPQFLILGGYILATRRFSELATGKPWLHVARSLVSVLSWFLFYVGFLRIDLALATALSFSSQLFVVALARLVLGEAVGPARLIATAIGFAGVIIATGVGTREFEPMAVFVIGSAMCGAAIVFMNRALTRTEHTSAITFYVGAITTAATLPLMLLWGEPMSAWAWGMLLLSGALGTIGNVMVTEGYRRSEVSALAPFPYLKLVYALVLGFVLFAEVPTGTTLLGAGVIVAATLAVTYVEHKRQGRGGGEEG